MSFFEKFDREEQNTPIILAGMAFFYLYFALYMISPVADIQKAIINNHVGLYLFMLIFDLVVMGLSCVFLCKYLVVSINHITSLVKEGSLYRQFSFLKVIEKNIATKSFFISILSFSVLVSQYFKVKAILHPHYIEQSQSIFYRDFFCSYLLALVLVGLVTISFFMTTQICCYIYISLLEYIERNKDRFHPIVERVKNFFNKYGPSILLVSISGTMAGILFDILVLLPDDAISRSSHLFYLFPLFGVLIGNSLIVSMIISNKSERKQMLSKKQEENESTIQPSNSFSDYKEVLSSFEKEVSQDTSLQNVINEIHAHIKTLSFLDVTLSIEDAHLISRIIEKEAIPLLTHYVSLPNELRMTRREILLSLLFLLEQALHEVINNVYGHHLLTLDKTSQLIASRYTK